jgi:hypothetical protein
MPWIEKTAIAPNNICSKRFAIDPSHIYTNTARFHDLCPYIVNKQDF